MNNMGKKARDKITGFEGVIVSKISYVTGCDQYGITPPAKDGDVKSTQYFDVGRVEVLGESISVSDVSGKKKGGPSRDAPQ